MTRRIRSLSAGVSGMEPGWSAALRRRTQLEPNSNDPSAGLSNCRFPSAG